MRDTLRYGYDFRRWRIKIDRRCELDRIGFIDSLNYSIRQKMIYQVKMHKMITEITVERYSSIPTIVNCFIRWLLATLGA